MHQSMVPMVPRMVAEAGMEVWGGIFLFGGLSLVFLGGGGGGGCFLYLVGGIFFPSLPFVAVSFFEGFAILGFDGMVLFRWWGLELKRVWWEVTC